MMISARRHNSNVVNFYFTDITISYQLVPNWDLLLLAMSIATNRKFQSLTDNPYIQRYSRSCLMAMIYIH